MNGLTVSTIYGGPNLLDIERRTRVRVGLHVSGTETKVVEVRPKSPAAEAGLKTGDRIIRVNDKPVHNGIDYYAHLLNQQPGSTVRLKVQRGKQALDLALVLHEIPIPDGRELARKLLGMSLQELSADDRSNFGNLADKIGLVVAAVERSSPAESVKMKTADLIVGIRRAPVRTLKDVALALEQTRAGDDVEVV